MDTKNQASAKIPAVRTYARDLEENRKAQGLASDSAITNETISIPEKKAELKHRETENKKINVPTPPQPKRKEMASLPPLSSLHKEKKSPTKVIAINTKNSSFIVDDSNNEIGATIITDTKRDRFKLFPAIITSIKEWFSEKKVAYKKRKTPKYTVPESTRRKGVIQRATGVTGKLTTSDFSSIHERIRQRKESEEKSEPSTTWTANTEPVFLLLDGPEVPKVTNVQVVAKKSFRTPAPQPQPVQEVKPQTQVTITPPPIEVPIIESTETSPELPAPEAPATSYSEPEYISEGDTNETGKATVSERFRLLLVNTNTLALGVSGLVIALIITIIYFYYILNREEAIIVESTDTTIELIIDTPLKLATGETNERRSLLKVLDIVRNESNSSTQIEFLFNGYNERPIPPQILISIFGITLEKNFAQSISILRFGFTNNKKPFIVMKVSDEIVAKGGLLNWENTIANDLADILNIETESLTNQKFSDSSITNTDIRILKNETGEVITYGIKNNTVIITTNMSDFGELSKLIK